MPQQIRNLILGVLPPLLAGLAVRMEPEMTALSRTHEAMLPLATIVLLAALLHPRLRHFLVVCLCFGVAFLAVRDTWRVNQAPLPQLLSDELLNRLRPICLWLVAILAASAGIGESIRPGTVWARRCYFGAAALYFTGLGVINYAWHGSWRSIVLFVTGITALLGCILADHLVEETPVSALADESDEALQQTLEAAHRTALQAKEWRDTIAQAIEDCENTMGSSSVPPRASH